MTDTTANNKRIAKNTFFLYGRMIIVYTDCEELVKILTHRCKRLDEKIAEGGAKK